MIEQYGRQGGFLLDEGETPQQVDKAMEKSDLLWARSGHMTSPGQRYRLGHPQRRYVEKPDMVYSEDGGPTQKSDVLARRPARAGTTTSARRPVPPTRCPTR
ncbi:MAG: hypothetical protein R3F00_16265 [Dokdonella sp.]